jgi:threonine synthase
MPTTKWDRSPLLARKAGICAEPAAAAALAGLEKLVQRGDIKKDDRVLVIISGSGLKDPNSSLSVRSSSFPLIDPSLLELVRTFPKGNS